jgi:hypothetical protein
VNTAVLEIPDSFYNNIQYKEKITLMAILGNQLIALINYLFNMMPAINRIRHVFLLRFEQEPQNPKPVHNTLTASPPVQQGPSGEAYGHFDPVYVPPPTTYPPSMEHPSYENFAHQKHFGASNDGTLQAVTTMSDTKPALSPPYGPHDPMLEMLAMDLELAEAIKESLALNQSSEKTQSSEDLSVIR